VGNTPKVQGGDRRSRAAAAREAARSAERRRRLIATVVGVVIVLAVVGAVVGLAVSRGAKKGSNLSSKPPAGSVPTWAAPTGDAAKTAVKSAGLQAFGTEMLTYHIHAHLDVIDNGNPVTVPPAIGFVYDSSGKPVGLTSLHTHQPDGIIHIEAAKPTDYTLGQFFKEWRVKLTKDCIGTLCADASHTVQFFVNGKRYTGDPAAIVLHKHDEIAAVYATKGKQVEAPSSYDFPQGL
jgi:hypothetical protein